MKIKTDLYTKIMLTAVVALLAAHLVKDINFVQKANASTIDLSSMKVEDVSDDEGTTFFVYENDKIYTPFDTNIYDDECVIGPKDIPTHIITSKKTPRYSYLRIKKH